MYYISVVKIHKCIHKQGRSCNRAITPVHVEFILRHHIANIFTCCRVAIDQSKLNHGSISLMNTFKYIEYIL